MLTLETAWNGLALRFQGVTQVTDWAQFLALLLDNWVTLGKLINLSGSAFFTFELE